MEDEHCRSRCQLYRQRTTNAVPPEGLFGYSVFQRLSSPAVERFHLEADVFDALGIRLSPEGTLDLIGQLDALMEGVDEAKRELADQKTRHGGRR